MKLTPEVVAALRAQAENGGIYYQTSPTNILDLCDAIDALLAEIEESRRRLKVTADLVADLMAERK